ncbi:MAG: cytochrome c oxidase subunit 3 [Gammaproteobacteria bacterium]|jgi:cytochrome c oxidase subunit III
MSQSNDHYYVPDGSYWPIIAAIAMTVAVAGAANAFNGNGMTVLAIGMALIIMMMWGWFGAVIKESLDGRYNEQVDRSFRQGMMWFIFSEVMFFAAFFGALFYVRILSVPWLLGEDASTHQFLWSAFTEAWPTNGPENVGGEFQTMGPWGIPAINTALLLASGVTITLSHHALKAGDNAKTVLWLWATILLGSVFLGFQAYEYIHAYSDLNLTLESGVYGSTFFMLTGFHGFHVTLGTIMLIVIALRAQKKHFSPEQHFAFEGVAWYWHFVDVVWLGLFIFVYVV